MEKNKFGEMVFAEQDLINLAMSNCDVWNLEQLRVSPQIDIQGLRDCVLEPNQLASWQRAEPDHSLITDFDRRMQSQWFMPESYKTLDIAEYVLALCTSDAELQRVGQELLLYQERGLFDLLRYLKYLVDTMTANHCIWGVGRGSSVASYVLYLLGVHKVNSLYYDLDPTEFLR